MHIFTTHAIFNIWLILKLSAAHGTHFKSILTFGGSNCGLDHFTSQPFIWSSSYTTP